MRILHACCLLLGRRALLLRKTTLVSLLPLMLTLAATPAMATSFSFIGAYTFSDEDSDDFSETLTFDNPFGSHSGAITTFDPGSDAIFSDAGLETVEIATLTLDPADPFKFDPTSYTDGFRVWDDDGVTLLLEADLEAVELGIEGSAGATNSSFDINLTNITAGGGYVPGSSEIIDAFLAAAGGAASLTLQLPNLNVADAISNGDDVTSTYSGSAAAIPEPGTLISLCLGLSLMSVAQGRRGSTR